MTISVPIDYVIDILDIKDKTNIKNEIKAIYRDIHTEIKDDNLIIYIDDIQTLETTTYHYLIKLSENNQFDKALKLADTLFPNYKQSSELNRIIGQIHFTSGAINKAENYLIEALKLNPKNTSALIVMGNVQYQKSNIDAGLLYWNAALRFNPDDYLALSNIGSTLAKDNHIDKAKYFFEQSIAINPRFGNALLGLGIISSKENNHNEAFTYAIKTLKSSNKKSQIYANAFNLFINSAKELIVKNTEKVENEIKTLKSQLEELTGKPLKIEIKKDIETPAKIVIAEYRNNKQHQLFYKQDTITTKHLILHEMYHLKLVADARQAENNKLFTSYKNQEDAFIQNNQSLFKKLRKNNIPEQHINKIVISIFQGLNSQIYNTPIDLFIEDLIYNNHPVSRPIQSISLINLVKQGIGATTSKQIQDTFPKKIISKSKILNLVNAMHLKNLYGVDMLDDFNPTKVELEQANTLYEEFEEYRKDKEPGEEYEIIQHWAEDLKIAKYFKLQTEKTQTKKTVDEVIDEINKDPYGLDSPEPAYKIKERQNFIDKHAKDDTNKAVTFFMIGAINFFKDKPTEEVKKIAMEFATLGMAGIDVNKSNYEVPSLDKTMSGYQTLAYYYTSWAIAIPDMLSQLQLPFDKEYGLAKKMASK
jgi:tetratricopeptide (TPR) repeat protein